MALIIFIDGWVDDDPSGYPAICEHFDGMDVRPCADEGDSHVTEVEPSVDPAGSNLRGWIALVRIHIIFHQRTRAYVELDSIDEPRAIVEPFTGGPTSLAGM